MLSCIVQKILLALKFKEDNQHNKIFRIRGIINDKVCKMIIDSNSSENIVLKMLLDVMGLLIKKKSCTTQNKVVKERDTNVSNEVVVSLSLLEDL